MSLMKEAFAAAARNARRANLVQCCDDLRA
jgi:hypothetical protein